MTIIATNTPNTIEQLSADSQFTNVVANATVNNGGTNGVVGALYDIQGGTLGPNGSPARVRVSSLSGSAVDQVILDQIGSYEVPPPAVGATVLRSSTQLPADFTLDLTFSEESIAVLDRRITEIVIANVFAAASGTVTVPTSAQALPSLISIGIIVITNIDSGNLYFANSLSLGNDLTAPASNAYVLQPGRDLVVELENANQIVVGSDNPGAAFSLYTSRRS